MTQHLFSNQPKYACSMWGKHKMRPLSRERWMKEFANEMFHGLKIANVDSFYSQRKAKEREREIYLNFLTFKRALGKIL